MNFDWKNIDLKTASIFDLTDDIELIRKSIDCSDFSLEDKDEFIKNLTDDDRFRHLIDFAYFTNDDKLEKAAIKTFPIEYANKMATYTE